jgi:hypothetical protein
MNLEYFYNLIQLFGVLLGLIGVFIVFRIQNLDTRIDTYRKIIVTSIAQYEALHPSDPMNQSSALSYNERVSHYFLIYNSYLNDPLLSKINTVITELDTLIRSQTGLLAAQNTQFKLFLLGVRDEWNNLRKKKIDAVASIKYPIIISAGIILFGLSITTYYTFELVNNISAISLISVSIFIFIVLAFLSLIYISKYIYYSVNELK